MTFNYKIMNKNGIQQMKMLFTFLFAIVVTFVPNMVMGQNVKVTLNKSNVALEQVMNDIEKQTKYLFIYNENLDLQRSCSINVNNEPLNSVLNKMLAKFDITYTITGTNIVLKKSQVSDEPVKVMGCIVDGTNMPIIGATVLVKGTTIGTTTDIDGNYEITVPGPANTKELEASYLGYQTSTHTVGNLTRIDFTLQEATTSVDAVVVTALGIKRSEKALSYNVQKVAANEITSAKDANFMNSLNGKVAGVNISKSSSGVGGATRVVMRGNKSIAGSNNVLYVIDGVPIGNQADREGDGSTFESPSSGEGIANFNPDDIESISVLTGPSAAALYGANAANGVILINTKKGKEGNLRVNFSTAVEMSNPYIMPEFQNTYGNRAGQYTSWGDKQASTGFEPINFFQTGVTYNNSVNLSAGTEKNQTYFSASAVNAEGNVDNNKYHRYNVTFRNTAKMVKDKLTLDLSANYVREFSNNMVSSGRYFNPIVGVYLYPRGMNFAAEKYFERYDAEVGYNRQVWGPGSMGLDVQNPYWIMYRNLRPVTKDRYMITGSLKWQIIDCLNIATRVRMDNTYTESEDKRYASTMKTFAAEKGRYKYTSEVYRQKYADIMMNFDKQFAEKYHATINAGVSFEEYDSKGHGFGGELLTLPNVFTWGNVNHGLAEAFQTGGNSRTNNFATFMSAELSWNAALYLTLTGRADKPSQLVNAKDEWVLYPSVGLSAIVTELLPYSWKDKMEKTLSYFKIRGSYTEVGSPIPFTGLTPGTVTHEIEGGAIKPFEFYPLDNFKPERTRSWEIGFDSRWFNNTVTLAVTYYHSNTLNQLLKADLPISSGYKFMYFQAGNVQNSGLELTLGFDKTWGNFNYNTTFTATTNKNKIKKLASNVKNPVTGEIMDLSDIKMGRFRLREGGQIGDMYDERRVARDEEGYIPYTPGQKINLETTEPYKIGTVNPDWNLGWRNGFSFKGFNLSALFTARIGGNVISHTQDYMDYFGVSKASADARDRGYVMLGNIKMQPKDYYDTVHDLDAYHVYSATNVRLQELTFGYTLPNKWFRNVVKNVTLSFYGTNLWMIYNKAPFDPELTAATGTYGQGLDYFMNPSNRTYGFSLKFSF